MPKHSETQFSPYTPAQLYALVTEVERYPEFLPWCRAARITERGQDYFLGELVISFKHITERYVSKVSGKPELAEPTIDVTLVSGPFEYLTNHWRFEPKDGGTLIHFSVDFRFRSRILEALIGGLFTRAAEKMTRAFMDRAAVLYGNNR
jgi:coenzyme Q-binding protein COQ10